MVDLRLANVGKGKEDMFQMFQISVYPMFVVFLMNSIYFEVAFHITNKALFLNKFLKSNLNQILIGWKYMFALTTVCCEPGLFTQLGK